MFKTLFATSPDVVMKASGLRLEAIRAIAREQGVDIEDTACRCIDESLLAALADAHVRRMRAYFNNVHRHVAELRGEELATYIDFCQTFKKRQSSDSSAQSWKDIDSDAIREQFIENVHRLTPQDSIFDLFIGCGNIQESAYATPSIKSSGNLETDTCEYKHRTDVIDRIISHHLYYVRPVKTYDTCIDNRSVVWRITLSSRYHLFITEDDDHQQDVINKYIINCAPAMVA